MSELPIDPDLDETDVSPQRPLDLAVVFVVGLGGVAGAEARYGLGVEFPHTSTQFPWLTLFINVIGCVLIGFVVGALEQQSEPSRFVRPFVATGLLGGFTTYSTFALDIDQLTHAGCTGIAIAYLLATVVLCLAGAAFGLAAMKRLVR